MIEEHFDQVRQLDGHWPLDHDWLLRNYRQARAALEASGLDLVPCFNDPMPGNFLIGDDKSIKLIDFEYASNNERLYDLAIWSGEMFYSEATDCEIIEEYFGRYDKAHHARFIVHKALADIKWSTGDGTKPDIDPRFRLLQVRNLEAYARPLDHPRPRWPLFLKAL